MISIDEVRKRLYSTIPAGSLHMNELLSLLAIRFSDTETDSACVTCTNKPELILNPYFIEKYCKTDEHLFMLVMHEIYHIILGHTKLYSNHTEIDNIAFDAIINAMLCRMFPDEEYISFFKNTNNSNSFPGCILRPKADDTPSEAIPLLDNIYTSDTGTYYDAYLTIINFMKNQDLSLYVLIGGHYKDNIKNPIIEKLIDKIVEKWPRPPKVLSGRDLGKDVKREKIKYENSIKKKKKMKKFLEKASVLSGLYETNKRKVKSIDTNAMSFIPNYKDRMMYAKKSLFNNVLIYNDIMKSYNFSSISHTKTFIYLDVSGSVIEDLKTFVPLLIEPYINNECSIYTFSTEVFNTNPKKILNGEIDTTGGTDINCIFQHYFSFPKYRRPKRIMILTDGFTGECSNYYLNMIKKDKLKIYVGLFGNYTKDELKNITTKFEVFV